MSSRVFTIAVLGGTGAFGQKACVLLRDFQPEEGLPLRILVVGRREQKQGMAVVKSIQEQAELLRQQRHGVTTTAASVAPAIAYRKADVKDSHQISQMMHEEHVDAVIDTVGPFQGQDAGADAFSVPRACLKGGVRLYTDLADAASYVSSIGPALTPAAEEAGAAVVSGASTVPALSGSVIEHLTGHTLSLSERKRLHGYQRDAEQRQFEPLVRTTDVDIRITPGNDAPRGAAVVSAIVGYAGKGLPRWQGGKWSLVPGWGDTEVGAIRGIPSDAVSLTGTSKPSSSGDGHTPAGSSSVLSADGLAVDTCPLRPFSNCEAPDVILWPQLLANAPLPPSSLPPSSLAPALTSAVSQEQRLPPTQTSGKEAVCPLGWQGLQSCSFRAGLELWSMHFGLQALALPVRMGLLESVGPLSPVLKAVADRLRWLGSDRGGMSVRVAGYGLGPLKAVDDVKGGCEGDAYVQTIVPVEREWSLIAGRGHGPYIPVTAAVALVLAEHRRQSQLESGSVSQSWETESLLPGARHAGGTVPLREFEEVWRRHGLCIESESFVTHSGTACGYGAKFDRAENAIESVTRESDDIATTWNGKMLLGDTLVPLVQCPPSDTGHSIGVHSATPMWRAAVGERRWESLDREVRSMHDWSDDPSDVRRQSFGRVRMFGQGGLVGWVFRRLLGFPQPPEAETQIYSSQSDKPEEAWCPLEVRMSRNPVTGRETWQRLFDAVPGEGCAAHAATRLTLGKSATDAGMVLEQPLPSVLGNRLPLPMTIQMRVGGFKPDSADSASTGLFMEGRGMTMLGMPLPSFLQPRVLGREWAGVVTDNRETVLQLQNGQTRQQHKAFHFDVSIVLPIFGEVAGYRGYLFEPVQVPPGGPWLRDCVIKPKSTSPCVVTEPGIASAASTTTPHA